MDLSFNQNICQICYTNEYSIILMPCCGNNNSSLKYCKRCIEIICLSSNDIQLKYIGRCPTCRSIIRYNKNHYKNQYINNTNSMSNYNMYLDNSSNNVMITTTTMTHSPNISAIDVSDNNNNNNNNNNNEYDGDTIEVVTNIGLCHICNTNQIIVERNLCEACLYGSIYSLRYECSNCHLPQRISYPLWRYQENSHSFGNYNWVCHRSCNDYTFWRILPEDIPIIPANDIPDSWGVRDQMVMALRQFRRSESEQQSYDERKPPQLSSISSTYQSKSCMIM